MNLPEFNKFLKNIKDITIKLLKNKNFDKLCSYKTKNNIHFKNLYSNLNNLKKDKKILIINNNTWVPSSSANEPHFKEKLPLLSAFTDFNSNELISTKKHRINFLYLIIETIKTMLREIYLHYNINNDKLNLLFKGGNVLRLLTHDFIKNFNNFNENILLKELESITKTGDFDFELSSLKNLEYSCSY